MDSPAPPIPGLLWKVGGPASTEKSAAEIAAAAVVAPPPMAQLPEETGVVPIASSEMYPPTTSSPPPHHSPQHATGIQPRAKAIPIPHDVPLPPNLMTSTTSNLTSPPRAVIQSQNISPPLLAEVQKAELIAAEVRERATQQTRSVRSASGGLTAAQQQLRQQQSAGSKFQPTPLTTQRFVAGRAATSNLTTQRRSSSHGATRAAPARRSGSTGATRKRSQNTAGGGDDVVQQSTARLAVSHTARSYALEKQNLLNKHEEVITSMKASHKEEIKALKKTITRMHSDYAMRRSEEVGALQDEITRLTESVQDSELRIVEAMQEKEEVLNSLKQSNERIKTLDALRADDKHRVIATIENWKQHFEKAEADTRLENASLKDQLLENTTRLVSIDHLQHQLQETERNLADTNAQLESCKTQLQHSTSRCRENEVNIGSLTRQIEVLTQENESLASFKNVAAADKNALLLSQTAKQQIQDKFIAAQQELTECRASEAALRELLKQYQQIDRQPQQQQQQEHEQQQELIESAEDAAADLTAVTSAVGDDNNNIATNGGGIVDEVNDVSNGEGDPNQQINSPPPAPPAPSQQPERSERERLLAEACEMEQRAATLRTLQDAQDRSPEGSPAIQHQIDAERSAALKSLQDAHQRDAIEKELAAQITIEREKQVMLALKEKEKEIDLQQDEKRPTSLSPAKKEQEQELLIQQSIERERRVAHLRTISPAPSAARCIPPTAPSPPGAGGVISSLY